MGLGGKGNQESTLVKSKINLRSNLMCNERSLAELLNGAIYFFSFEI